MSKNLTNKNLTDSETNSTEFGYLDGFYLKISYSQNIVISVYDLELLDGRRFEAQMTVSSLHRLSPKFNDFQTPKELYLFLIKLIKENNFKITPSGDTNLILRLVIKENNLEEEARIFLTNYERKYGNYKNTQEFITILINEIMRLKNSKGNIDELEEENKELRSEINSLKEIISINKANFKPETKEKMSVEEFNKKFNLNVQNNEIKKLDLYGKKFGNEILNYLVNIEFNELIKLYLGNNNLTDIKMLEYMNFDKLEKLSLIDNKIIDINVFEKVQFNNLTELYLYNNNISSIRALENAKFKNLLVLSLGNNKITKYKIWESKSIYQGDKLIKTYILYESVYSIF